MKHQKWSHDVICTITDDNDNIQRPIVRLIFEQHNIPTTNIISSKILSPHIFEDECCFALNDDDVFHKKIYIPDNNSYGNIYFMTSTFKNNYKTKLVSSYRHHTSVLPETNLPTHQPLFPR